MHVAVVDAIEVRVCEVPTDEPESDATLAWEATTIVIVRVRAGGVRGLGYTYGDAAAGRLVEDKLADVVVGRDPLDLPAAWLAMVRAARNDGRPGLASMAISAVDVALHDLRARMLELPLVAALGAFHDAVPVYGSGGFCSYADGRLAEQLGGWAREGLGRVKMKVGREPDRDRARVRAAREAIGADVELFVDANGAYGRREARRWAEVFAAEGVTYFEEPVSSDDVDGLRLVRDRGPASVAVAAGEYGYHLPDFRALVDAVDVLQADVTRCGGITELLRVGALAQAHGLPLSAHGAPALSAHAWCAVQDVFPLEWFHDHVRVESRLFDGVLVPDAGMLRPDRARVGHGLELREDVAEGYRSA